MNREETIGTSDSLHAFMMGEIDQELMMVLVRQFELRDEKIEALQAENTKMTVGWEHDKTVLASWKETAQRVAKEKQIIEAENAELSEIIRYYRMSQITKKQGDRLVELVKRHD